MEMQRTLRNTETLDEFDKKQLIAPCGAVTGARNLSLGRGVLRIDAPRRDLGSELQRITGVNLTRIFHRHGND